MDEGIQVNLAVHVLPNGEKRLRFLVFSGDVLQFLVLLAPAEAEILGKKMQDIAIELRTGIVVPPGAVIDA
jgi:hypothetical protein